MFLLTQYVTWDQKKQSSYIIWKLSIDLCFFKTVEKQNWHCFIFIFCSVLGCQLYEWLKNVLHWLLHWRCWSEIRQEVRWSPEKLFRKMSVMLIWTWATLSRAQALHIPHYATSAWKCNTGSGMMQDCCHS